MIELEKDLRTLSEWHSTQARLYSEGSPVRISFHVRASVACRKAADMVGTPLPSEAPAPAPERTCGHTTCKGCEWINSADTSRCKGCEQWDDDLQAQAFTHWTPRKPPCATCGGSGRVPARVGDLASGIFVEGEVGDLVDVWTDGDGRLIKVLRGVFKRCPDCNLCPQCGGSGRVKCPRTQTGFPCRVDWDDYPDGKDLRTCTIPCACKVTP